MPMRRACSAIGMAAVAAWLIQPAFAQESGETVPDEMRIIEDLPEAAEEGQEILDRTNGRTEAGRTEADERADEVPTILEGNAGTLFDGDYSLLFAPPEGSPAERLLPDESDRSVIERDRRFGDRDRDDIPAARDPLADDPLAEDPLADDPLRRDPLDRDDTAADGTAEPQEPAPRSPDRRGSQGSGSVGGAGGSGSGSLF